MSQQRPTSLRLFQEEHPDEQRLAALSPAEWEALQQAFVAATGWNLALAEPASSPSGGEPPCVTAPQMQRAVASPNVPEPAACQLGEQVAKTFAELQTAREEVWRREAELAACVPVTLKRSEATQFANLLEAVLRGAAEATSADASALYLLDETTSEIKLRSCWGITRDRLLAPARPLRGSLAELEALLGHAVVIDDAANMPAWPLPEEFSAACCVPVASASHLLGVMWTFSRLPRDFAHREVACLELSAGRIAAELERMALARETTMARRALPLVQRAQRWRQQRLPPVAPVVDDWQIAAWCSAEGEFASDWYDWSVLPDGRLAVALGVADGRELTAALNGAAMQAAFRAHGAHRHQPASLLRRLNDTLWTASSGGEGGSLFYATIEPETGECQFASAGAVCGLLARNNAHRTLRGEATPLGYDPDWQTPSQRRTMQRRDALVLLSSGALQARNTKGRKLTAGTVSRHAAKANSADKVLETLRTLLQKEFQAGERRDCTVMVIRRR